MRNLSQFNFTQQELNDLQRLRALAFAFQRMIANLDANEQNNDHNEQFNKIRAETKTILNRRGLNIEAPQAVTSTVLAQRNQKVSMRLSGIVIFGVLLALLGLGINSIILEDVIINSLGCLISTGGILLIIGALVVLGVNSTRRQLTNLGDLYVRCDALLHQLDGILSDAIPGYAASPSVEPPNIPSAAALTLDSLENQADDWKRKLEDLEQQRFTLGPNTPVELTSTINYVQRELDRIEYEIVDLRERVELPLVIEQEPVSIDASVAPPPKFEPNSDAVRAARAHTQEMPALKPESDAANEPEEDAHPPQ